MAIFFHPVYNPQFEESGQLISSIFYKWFIHDLIVNTCTDERMTFLETEMLPYFFSRILFAIESAIYYAELILYYMLLKLICYVLRKYAYITTSFHYFSDL